MRVRRSILNDLPPDCVLVIYTVTVSQDLRQFHHPRHYGVWSSQVAKLARSLHWTGFVFPHWTNDDGLHHPHYHVGLFYDRPPQSCTKLADGNRLSCLFTGEKYFDDSASSPLTLNHLEAWTLLTDNDRARALNYVVRSERTGPARITYQPKGLKRLRRFGKWSIHSSRVSRTLTDRQPVPRKIVDRPILAPFRSMSFTRTGVSRGNRSPMVPTGEAWGPIPGSERV